MQRLIIEESQKVFRAAVNALAKNGYKIVTGSTYVKSLEVATNPILGLKSFSSEPFMSVVLEDESGGHIIMCHNDLDKFREEVNIKLDIGFKVIVGSTYFTDLSDDGSQESFKSMTTFYTCCLDQG